MLQETVSLGEVLPANHLARFVVDVISQLDLSQIHAQYAPRGGEPFAPEILPGLLCYGYCTGTFSSRKIEKATYESIPFRYIAGGLHPDHDTIAHFRKAFLEQIQELFVQILLIAQGVGVLKMGNLSLDGSKVYADAPKSHVVNYGRLIVLEAQLQQAVHELLELGEQADQGEASLPAWLVVEEAASLREKRLAQLAEARNVLQARAEERYRAEKVEYDAKVAKRSKKARKSHRTCPSGRCQRKPKGQAPQEPQPGAREKDQYNFTACACATGAGDPDSRIMKNSTNDGFDQHYNVEVAVDQEIMLIVANALSNHPNDKQEALPTLQALPGKIDPPEAVAPDNGYFSESNILACEKLGIDAYIATGREPHHLDWHTFFRQQPEPPADDASPIIKMAYKLQTEIGHAIYRLRKCTVERIIGIIKEILGFRQFSLRGLRAAAGEWSLVCLAFNLKRLHIPYQQQGPC